MLGQKNVKTFDKTLGLLESDVVARFPNISQHIDSINLTRGFDNPISGATKASGIFAQVDSKVSQVEDVRASNMGMTSGLNPNIRMDITDSYKQYVDKTLDSLIAKGKTEAEAKKMVADSVSTYIGYDKAHDQYVVMGKEPAKNGAVADSLLEHMSIPMWNVSFLTKIFKQPMVDSKARYLVSIESGSNPWANIFVALKESFEGYGNISTTARGEVTQNNSHPVKNHASEIASEIFNLSVDFESDFMEDLAARQPGNTYTGPMRADREKYSKMILDRMQDALIYFGSAEAGMDGLMDITPVQIYTGTPLIDIFNSDSTTKGADIVEAMNKLVGDFLRENHYMAREVRINVSEFTFQALTQSIYSKEFNPQNAISILNMNYKGQNELDGGLVQCKYSIVSDTMCNPNTVWNKSNYDLTFITVPKIEDALTGTQDSLVIVPETLKNFIAPAMPTKSGLLYTNYRRMGGVIAPIEGTVKVVMGLGYQGK